MSSVLPKESESSKRDSVGKSIELSISSFEPVDKQSADFNQVTNSTDESEPAKNSKTGAALMKKDNNDISVSASNDKQAQICKENKASECNSSFVETKIMFEKYQVALCKKYVNTYYHNAIKKYELARLNAMYEELFESYSDDFYDSDSDEFYDSDSDTEVITVCIRTYIKCM